MKELKDAMADLKVHMQQNKEQIEQLKAENCALMQKLALTENAQTFSAGSGYQGDFGLFNTYVNIVFSNVLTNIGNAYSPNTGVYHSTFTIFGLRNTHFIGAKFFKND
ncbi:hypothetical protein KOW79_014027 [Hemibagrus wyckioides]|uniref:Uncharacterized protein n=1 Tax=Hemibagrus wyckioides TaxID=337641 RepID=A0A9D3NHD1_9TELE|nr:hypothetical protein KOW79_014027 [Hemibagrus wyckioides]